MVSRLVVGCGSVGRTIVSALADRPGDVLVVCDNEHRIETLRSEGVDTERASRDHGEVLCGHTRTEVGGHRPSVGGRCAGPDHGHGTGQRPFGFDWPTPPQPEWPECGRHSAGGVPSASPRTVQRCECPVRPAGVARHQKPGVDLVGGFQ